MAEVTSHPPDVAASAGTATSDWTVQAADTIESVVGTIRDKTVVPATTIARALVYGLVAAVLGLVILVLVVTMIVRLGASYLPWWFADRHGRSAWVTEAVLGGILSGSGLLLIRKANAKNKD